MGCSVSLSPALSLPLTTAYVTHLRSKDLVSCGMRSEEIQPVSSQLGADVTSSAHTLSSEHARAPLTLSRRSASLASADMMSSARPHASRWYCSPYSSTWLQET